MSQSDNNSESSLITNLRRLRLETVRLVRDQRTSRRPSVRAEVDQENNPRRSATPQQRQQHAESMNTQGAYAVRGPNVVRRTREQNRDQVSIISNMLPGSSDYSSTVERVVLPTAGPITAEVAPAVENDSLRRRVDNIQEQLDQIQKPDLLQEEEENESREITTRMNQRQIMWWLILLFLSNAVTAGVIVAIMSGNCDNDSAPLEQSPFPTVSPTTAVPQEEEWRQLGQELRGGESVSLSGDASVIAVGTTEEKSKTEELPGSVLVFSINVTSWVPMGQELVGEARFGKFVCLNGAGDVLAIASSLKDGDAGAVVVYDFNNDTQQWEERGSEVVEGQQGVDHFVGTSISLSEGGDVLAVGALGSDSLGSVRLLQYNADAQVWRQLGPTLMDGAVDFGLGVSVSLSGSGMVVAIGAKGNDAGGSNAGQVSAYQYNSTELTWEPMGDPIQGQDDGDELGCCVSLDRSGLVMAVSSSATNGIVMVFEFDDEMSAWIQRGETISDEGTFDRFGISLSLSRDGNVVAVGTWGNSRGVASGHVRVFEYNENTEEWSQLGSTLTGEGDFMSVGTSVSLSDNGTVVGIGGHGKEVNVVASGRTRVYTNG